MHPTVTAEVEGDEEDVALTNAATKRVRVPSDSCRLAATSRQRLKARERSRVDESRLPARAAEARAGARLAQRHRVYSTRTHRVTCQRRKQTNKQTQTNTNKHKQTQKKTETHRNTHKHTKTNKNKQQTKTKTNTKTNTNKHKNKQTQTKTNTNKHKNITPLYQQLVARQTCLKEQSEITSRRWVV